MKKRSMILALASMLGISAAATAVSGFAWFTAQTTASVNEHAYTVGSSQGSLTITAGSSNTNASVAVTNNVAAITRTSGALADVSSKDGLHFYQLKNIKNVEADDEHGIAAVHTAEVADEGDLKATTHMSSVNTSQLVAVSWSLNVTNDGGVGSSMDVYISKASPIFVKSAGTQENGYVNAYRMAIYDMTESTTAPVFLYSNSSAYIKAEDFDSTTKAYKYDTCNGWDGTGVLASTDYVTGDAMKLITSSTCAGSVAKATALTQGDQLLIKALPGAANPTPHVLKFIVWCEGTATPEAVVDTANEVKCSFELAGIAA